VRKRAPIIVGDVYLEIELTHGLRLAFFLLMNVLVPPWSTDPPGQIVVRDCAGDLLRYKEGPYSGPDLDRRLLEIQQVISEIGIDQFLENPQDDH
jgi:hypothetical protein